MELLEEEELTPWTKDHIRLYLDQGGDFKLKAINYFKNTWTSSRTISDYSFADPPATSAM